MRTLIGLILLSPCFRGITNAHPVTGLPEVSLGSNPHRFFSGPIAPGETIPLIDVPADQEFIVTMVTTTEAQGSRLSGGSLDTDGIRMLQGTSVVLSGEAIHYRSSFGYPNRGHLRIEAGTSVSIHSGSGTSPDAYYQVQGYFVQAPSPYQSVYGISPSTLDAVHPIFTNGDSRDYMIRTAILDPESGYGPGACDLYIDGTIVMDGSSQLMYVTTAWSTLTKGTGAIPLPAGSTLQVKTVEGVPCQYYVDGEYIAP